MIVKMIKIDKMNKITERISGNKNKPMIMKTAVLRNLSGEFDCSFGGGYLE